MPGERFFHHQNLRHPRLIFPGRHTKFVSCRPRYCLRVSASLRTAPGSCPQRRKRVVNSLTKRSVQDLVSRYRAYELVLNGTPLLADQTAMAVTPDFYSVFFQAVDGVQLCCAGKAAALPSCCHILPIMSSRPCFSTGIKPAPGVKVSSPK